MRLVLFSVLTLALCAMEATALAGEASLECKLFAAVVEQGRVDTQSSKQIYLNRETYLAPLHREFSCSRLRPELRGLDEETCDAFTANNQKPMTIDCSAAAPSGHAIVMNDDMRLDQCRVSRAGVSRDGTAALFFLDCLTGDAYLMRLERGRWNVSATRFHFIH